MPCCLTACIPTMHHVRSTPSPDALVDQMALHTDLHNAGILERNCSVHVTHLRRGTKTSAVACKSISKAASQFELFTEITLLCAAQSHIRCALLRGAGSVFTGAVHSFCVISYLSLKRVSAVNVGRCVVVS